MRQRTDKRGAGEHHKANHVDAAIPENVAERRERQQRDDDGELIGIDNPDRIGSAGVDLLGNRRQRDIGDRAVEHRQGDPDGEVQDSPISQWERESVFRRCS